MGFLKDFRNLFGKRAVAERALGRLHIQLGNMFAGEPVVGLAEEVVAHLTPVHEVEALGVGPEAQDLGNVYLAGHIHVMRQAFGPAGAPVRAEHVIHLLSEPLLDFGDGGGDVVVVLECLEVAVKIAGLRGTAAESVHLGAV